MSQYMQHEVDLGEDNTDLIITAVIVCMALSGLSVISRFTSRYLKKTSITTSDWLILGGLAGAWVISLIIIQSAKRGLGKHVQTVGMVSVREILLATYIGELFYSISFPLIKISILLFYRQIFASRFVDIATIGIAIFVTMWGIALLFVTIFSCQPIHGFWDLTIQSKCVDSETFFWANSIPNILADILILCLPVNEIRKIRMSLSDKTLVCGIFLTGNFVVIASGLRIYYLLGMDLMDMTWSYQGVGLWTAVEIDIAIISACLPLIRPTLKFLIPSFVISYVSKLRSTQGTEDRTGESSEARSTRSKPSIFHSQSDYKRLVAYPMKVLTSKYTSRVEPDGNNNIGGM